MWRREEVQRDRSSWIQLRPLRQFSTLQIIAGSPGCYLAVLILILIKTSKTTTTTTTSARTKESRTGLEEEADRSCRDSGRTGSLDPQPVSHSFLSCSSFSGSETSVRSSSSSEPSPLSTWGGTSWTGLLIRCITLVGSINCTRWVDMNKDDPLLLHKNMQQLRLSNFKVNNKVTDWQTLPAWNRNDRNEMPQLMWLPAVMLVWWNIELLLVFQPPSTIQTPHPKLRRCWSLCLQTSCTLTSPVG